LPFETTVKVAVAVFVAAFAADAIIVLHTHTLQTAIANTLCIGLSKAQKILI